MATITREMPAITRQALWKKSFWRHARIPAIFVGSFLLVCILGLPYLHLDSRSNNMATEIRRLSHRREGLRREVSELNHQLAAAQSLSRVTKRATALGLREASEVNVLALEFDQEGPETTPLGALAGGLDSLRAFLQDRFDMTPEAQQLAPEEGLR